jgi:hypothetical protein
MKNATDFINLVFCGCKDSEEPNEQKKLKQKKSSMKDSDMNWMLKTNLVIYKETQMTLASNLKDYLNKQVF